MKRVMTLHWLLAATTATALLVFCAEAGSQTAAENKKPNSVAGDAAKGKELFSSYGCYQCHGRQAQGAKTSGPRLAPNPFPFPAFSKYIRQPKGQMPPYTARVVSDADLSDIYAFLKTLPQPTPAKDIPLLN